MVVCPGVGCFVVLFGWDVGLIYVVLGVCFVHRSLEIHVSFFVGFHLTVVSNSVQYRYAFGNAFCTRGLDWHSRNIPLDWSIRMP